VKGTSTTVGEAAIGPGAMTLSIEAAPDEYSFFVEGSDGRRVSLGRAPTVPLSSEAAGGFTGAYFGLYATAGPRARAPAADFDWFEFAPRGE